MKRRNALAGIGLLSLATPGISLGTAPHSAPKSLWSRADWLALLEKVVRPVLQAASQGKLKAQLPIETRPGTPTQERAPFAVTEALCRTLAGMAPWLQAGNEGLLGNGVEFRLWKSLSPLAQQALEQAFRKGGADELRWDVGPQCLVEAAFLSEAFLRAPYLLQGLSASTKDGWKQALLTVRRITPYNNNWHLFAALAEGMLAQLGEAPDSTRVERAIRLHAEWYKGDGHYGDGPDYHADYYNSFVIHPMLREVLAAFPQQTLLDPGLAEKRFRRYAQVQERMISPTGTFPPLGRSLCYRSGAFQALAWAVRKGETDNAPRDLRALSLMLAAIPWDKCFDAQGWLRLGFAGSQPSLAETYICTGSLYLCTQAFLPLGLPASHPTWQGYAQATTTSEALYSGQDLEKDSALKS